jgi:hypothetical protein
MSGAPERLPAFGAQSFIIVIIIIIVQDINEKTIGLDCVIRYLQLSSALHASRYVKFLRPIGILLLVNMRNCN